MIRQTVLVARRRPVWTIQPLTCNFEVGLTCQHTNREVLVEGPEIRIRPVGLLVQIPLARRLGRPEPATPADLARTADQLASLIVNGSLSSQRQDLGTDT
jgi:hypothetical protein